MSSNDTNDGRDPCATKDERAERIRLRREKRVLEMEIEMEIETL